MWGDKRDLRRQSVLATCNRVELTAAEAGAAHAGLETWVQEI
jgi:glutamyl-tRNA reductase